MKASMRWTIGIVTGLAILVGGGWWATQWGLQALKGAVEQALGQAQLQSIEVRGGAVVLEGLSLPAAEGWPAEQALSAQRITLRPDWASLPALWQGSSAFRIASIEVTDAKLLVWRDRSGRLRLLPSLLERPAAAPEAPNESISSHSLQIGRIVLTNAAVDFFDATVARPAHRVPIEALQAELTDLALPALDARSQLSLRGEVPGPRHRGEFSVQGWIVLANQDSELEVSLRGLDLLTIQPWMLQTTDTRIAAGTADLALRSTIEARRLQAPGRLTLNNLQLADGGSARATFMGVPRQAVLAFLRDQQGRIELDFAMAGNLDDPQFSLNEDFSRRLASGLAGNLGLSLETLARGAGTVGATAGQAAGAAAQGVGQAAQGVGQAIRGLFGN